MRLLLPLGALFAGCYDPAPRGGAPCTTSSECPTPLSCHDGTCLATPRDASTEDGDPPIDPLEHVELAAGWSVTVYRDFSAAHSYNAQDWMEETDYHSNAPRQLVVLHAPFPQVLGVLAGRQLILLSPTDYIVHDYGQHVRNTDGQLDHFSDMVWSDAAGAPALLATSSSEDGGDGLFSIDPAWTIAQLSPRNNMRAVAHDPTGTFDARGVPTIYYGGQYELRVHGEGVLTSATDAHSLRIAGTSLLYVDEPTTGSYELVEMESTTHAKTVLATRSWIAIAEGDPVPPGLAYAILDGTLARVDPGPELHSIASTTDPAFAWHSAATPPPDHPLASSARSIYVMESNRELDLDRVLLFTQD